VYVKCFAVSLGGFENNYVECVIVIQHSSQQRLRSLQSLLAFIEQAAEELAWLNEKEEIEIARDWSSQNLQLQELEDYFEAIY